MQSIKLNDTSVAYTVQGRGRPILFVHGFPLDHSMWSAQVAALSDECRVILSDLRGFGRTPLAGSDRQADEMAQSGVMMEEYAADLAALLDAIGINEPVIFAAFSMGGYIAWQFWKRYPERVGALVLCDTRAVADTADARAARLEMADHVVEWGAERVASLMLPKLFAPESFVGRTQLVEATRQVIASTDPRAIAAAQRGMAGRQDVSEWLPRIDMPTLVVVGEKDAISRVEEMESIAQALPNAELTVVPAAGHMAPAENPEVVNRALTRFLQQLP